MERPPKTGKGMRVTLDLSQEEAKELQEALIDADDSYSGLGGYKSPERQKLTDKLYDEIEWQLDN